LSTEGRDYEAVGVKGIDYVKRPGFAIDNIYKKDSYGNIIGLKFDFNLWNDVPEADDPSYTHKVFTKLDMSGEIGDPDNVKNNLWIILSFLQTENIQPAEVNGIFPGNMVL